jgi:hypothetical protein
MMRTVGIADQPYSGALRLHAALYERTDGRVGHRILGVPTVLLRTARAIPVVALTPDR